MLYQRKSRRKKSINYESNWIQLNTTPRRIYIRSGIEALVMEEQTNFEFAAKTKAIFVLPFTFVLNPA